MLRWIVEVRENAAFHSLRGSLPPSAIGQAAEQLVAASRFSGVLSSLTLRWTSGIHYIEEGHLGEANGVRLPTDYADLDKPTTGENGGNGNIHDK